MERHSAPPQRTAHAQMAHDLPPEAAAAVVTAKQAIERGQGAAATVIPTAAVVLTPNVYHNGRWQWSRWWGHGWACGGRPHPANGASG